MGGFLFYNYLIQTTHVVVTFLPGLLPLLFKAVLRKLKIWNLLLSEKKPTEKNGNIAHLYFNILKWDFSWAWATGTIFCIANIDGRSFLQVVTDALVDSLRPVPSGQCSGHWSGSSGWHSRPRWIIKLETTLPVNVLWQWSGLAKCDLRLAAHWATNDGILTEAAIFVPWEQTGFCSRDALSLPPLLKTSGDLSDFESWHPGYGRISWKRPSSSQWR